MSASVYVLVVVSAVAVALASLVLVEPRAALSRRRRVQVLLSELGATPSPGTLPRSVGSLIGDERCAVAYRVGNELIGADGAPLELARRDDGLVLHEGELRAVTPLVRGGETVALLLHDPGLVDTERLTRRIGEAARLAIDNERLAAALAARLHELRDARRRVVERGDRDRHELERNLHDGAQQLLVSLAIDLRTAALDAPAGAAGALAEASSELRAALEEVREIAHGIFPTILHEAGVRAALDRLAETAPLVVEIAGDDPGRLASASEHAAYALVGDAIELAAATGASGLAITFATHASTVDLRLSGVASPVGAGADRVVAAGGTLTVDETSVVATLPR